MLCQENKKVFIESNVENSDKSLVLYKHNNKIDTFRIYVSKNKTKIFDYKFNIDSTICTIIFSNIFDKIGEEQSFRISKFYFKNNWKPIIPQYICTMIQTVIKKDTIIHYGCLPKLVSFDKIQINKNIIETNRNKHEQIRSNEVIYFLKFDENDNLIETSIE